ncbi:MAG: TetR/AcrR family transcriptional regulator [Brevinema sp.]
MPITRREQAKQTRERIFQAVLDLIKQSSWNDLQISGICKRCGVSVGTFYHYFPSKQSLIIDLINNVQESFLENIAAIPRDKAPMDRILDTLWEVNTLIEGLGKELISGLFIYDLSLPNETVFKQLIPIITTITADIKLFLDELNIDANIDTTIDFLAMVHRGILYNWCSNPESPRLRDQVHLHFKIYFEMLINSRKA